VAGGEPAWLASWPAAMDLCGARGQGARKPQNARELDRERAEGEGSSPARRTGSEEARFGPLALGESRRRSGDGSRRLRTETEVERSGMKSGSSGTGLGASKRQDTGGRGNGIVGAGGAACGRQFDCREREGRRRLREERGEADNRAPRVRERREERRVAAGWAWPKKKQGARVGVSGPKAEREGEIPTSIYIFFYTKFSKYIFQLNFLSNLTLYF
jgi:hypothetical protein